MIRRLLARLLPGKQARTPRIYPPDQHDVRGAQLSNPARTVIRRLQEEGFKAYVVGGAVRDLLLGLRPKDFDVATTRRPSR
jgi:tRNA nucleotidyltransferase/poly(A) polymerase